MQALRHAARSGVVCLAILAFAGLSQSAWAVVLSAGNGNTDSASLIAAGGPGLNGTPGFGNVGSSGASASSIVYLGNRWVLSAGHVAIGTFHGQVFLGGTGYNVVDSTITYLHNPDNSLADLKLFQIDQDPGLPQFTSQMFASATPSGRQIMIGNGLDRGSPQTYWNVDDSQVPWEWSVQSDPGTPGADDYSGFQTITNHHIRWGENEVLATGLFEMTAFGPNNAPLFVHGYSTQFDDLAYTGVQPLPSEGQVSLGDSGGAVFTLEGGAWKLGGIMVAFEDLYSGQPQSPPGIPYTVFGNQALIVDLSVYRDEILTIVPEPTGLALAAVAGLALAAFYRRRGITR
ncbi:MAG: hypothetical protein AB7O59_12110 [Pirellulales bacterium]